MATRWNAALSDAAQRLVVVHIKLPPRLRNTLKAALILEGSTMQAYFTAMAQAKVAEMSDNTPETAAPTPCSPPSSPCLIPGDTYRMPTGRYIHWCAVCGNLWRSGEGQPVHCGHRRCHSPYWRTGKPQAE